MKEARHERTGRPVKHGMTKQDGVLTFSKGVVILFLVILTLAACGGKEKPSIPPPSPVAVVNGASILQTEFEKALAAEMVLAKGEKSLTPEEIDSLKEAVLDNLIREKIMFQRARELSLGVNEVELAGRIDEIKKDYGAEKFGELFGDGRIDYGAWKEALRMRLLFEKLIARDVNAGIQVTDEEAERFFKANRKAYVMEKRVRVAQIVLPDRDRAEAILKRLKAGEDFDKVAREVSIGPEAARGGDLGFIEPGVMPEAIDRMVFSLPVGKLSSVAQSPYGFHIFKVLSREAAGGRNFSDVKEKLTADLRKLKEAEAYQSWIDGLKAKAAIRIDRPLPGGPVVPADAGGTDDTSAPKMK
jgi:peptidyl-prolyl cis-trans isomerase C